MLNKENIFVFKLKQNRKTSNNSMAKRNINLKKMQGRLNGCVVGYDDQKFRGLVVDVIEDEKGVVTDIVLLPLIQHPKDSKVKKRAKNFIIYNNSVKTQAGFLNDSVVELLYEPITLSTTTTNSKKAFTFGETITTYGKVPHWFLGKCESYLSYIMGLSQRSRESLWDKIAPTDGVRHTALESMPAAERAFVEAQIRNSAQKAAEEKDRQREETRSAKKQERDELNLLRCSTLSGLVAYGLGLRFNRAANPDLLITDAVQILRLSENDELKSILSKETEDFFDVYYPILCETNSDLPNIESLREAYDFFMNGENYLYFQKMAWDQLATKSNFIPSEIEFLVNPNLGDPVLGLRQLAYFSLEEAKKADVVSEKTLTAIEDFKARFKGYKKTVNKQPNINVEFSDIEQKLRALEIALEPIELSEGDGKNSFEVEAVTEFSQEELDSDLKGALSEISHKIHKLESFIKESEGEDDDFDIPEGLEEMLSSLKTFFMNSDLQNAGDLSLFEDVREKITDLKKLMDANYIFGDAKQQLIDLTHQAYAMKDLQRDQVTFNDLDPDNIETLEDLFSFIDDIDEDSLKKLYTGETGRFSRKHYNALIGGIKETRARFNAINETVSIAVQFANEEIERIIEEDFLPVKQDLELGLRIFYQDFQNVRMTPEGMQRKLSEHYSVKLGAESDASRYAILHRRLGS